MGIESDEEQVLLEGGPIPNQIHERGEDEAKPPQGAHGMSSVRDFSKTKERINVWKWEVERPPIGGIGKYPKRISNRLDTVGPFHGQPPCRSVD